MFINRFWFEIGANLIYNGERYITVISKEPDGFYILEDAEGWRKRVYYKTVHRLAERVRIYKEG